MKHFIVNTFIKTPKQNQPSRPVPFSDVDTVILMLTFILLALLTGAVG